MGNRKAWAIVLGATAGVAMVSLAVTWYVKTHREGDPAMRDVQGMITDAYDKIRSLEKSLTNWHGLEEPA